MFLNSYVGWFCSCLIRLEEPWLACVLMNNSETRSSRDIKADMLYGDIVFFVLSLSLCKMKLLHYICCYRRLLNMPIIPEKREKGWWFISWNAKWKQDEFLPNTCDNLRRFYVHRCVLNLLVSLFPCESILEVTELKNHSLQHEIIKYAGIWYSMHSALKQKFALIGVIRFVVYINLPVQYLMINMKQNGY